VIVGFASVELMLDLSLAAARREALATFLSHLSDRQRSDLATALGDRASE
jgi:hypothetical protein